MSTELLSSPDRFDRVLVYGFNFLCAIGRHLAFLELNISIIAVFDAVVVAHPCVETIFIYFVLFCSLQQRMTLLFNSNFHHVLFLQDLSVLDDLYFLMSFSITIKNKPIFSVILCSAVIFFQQARKS